VTHDSLRYINILTYLLTYILSRTVFTLLQIIGQVLAFDSG